MTRCIVGPDHDFPIEDETGAHCPEHGVTLLWHSEAVTEDDLASPPVDEQPPA